MSELILPPEAQLVILEETLKPRLDKFILEVVYGKWRMSKEELRLVDESAFLFTGIPIYGNHLAKVAQGEYPHIHIAVKDEKYNGPRNNEQPFAHKIVLPRYGYDMSGEYQLAIPDLVKGSKSLYQLPNIEINLGQSSILAPEPIAHIQEFAKETILFYTKDDLKTSTEPKIRLWFEKLKLIRDVSRHVGRLDVARMAQLMIELSIERWRTENWSWLIA